MDELVRVILSRLIPMQKMWGGTAETVLLNIRLPRVFAAVMIGSALSGAGVAYQSLFQNPMVSPDVLGASAGAGFGAAIGISFSLSFLGVTLTSFLFGLGAVAIAYLVSTRIRRDPSFGMVLAGIVTGSLFSSGTSYLKLIADPNDTLPSITYWLMGSLASIRPQDIALAAVPIVLGLVPLLLFRWRLNILAMGEEEARTLGVHTGRLRLIIVCCATLVTSASVAVSGMIGWVGLVIPHLARMLVGSDSRLLMPASMLLGGTYLMMVDTLARLIAASEIPLGILTSFVGAPFFLFLMLRRRRMA
jgi:iron complex transport system permease protein